MTILEGGPGSGFLSGFASGYQFGFSEGLEVLPETRPRSFIDAIGRCLDADATLAALLGSLAGAPGSDPSMGFGSGFASGYASGFLIGSGDEAAATSGARKVWHRLAPARTDLPLLVFSVEREARRRVAGDTYTTEGRILIRAQARTFPGSATAADRAAEVLRRGDRDDTVVWSHGRLMDVWDLDDSSASAPRPAPYSGLLWEEARILGFKFQGLHA